MRPSRCFRASGILHSTLAAPSAGPLQRQSIPGPRTQAPNSTRPDGRPSVGRPRFPSQTGFRQTEDCPQFVQPHQRIGRDDPGGAARSGRWQEVVETYAMARCSSCGEPAYAGPLAHQCSGAATKSRASPATRSAAASSRAKFTLLRWLFIMGGKVSRPPGRKVQWK